MKLKERAKRLKSDMVSNQVYSGLTKPMICCIL